MKKLKEFNHVILTRFNIGVYERPDSAEWMEKRLRLFEETKDSVLSQRGDFTWVISFDKNTPDEVVSEVCSDSRMSAVARDLRELKMSVDTPYVITSRLDNDDLYLPGAVEAIQAAFHPQVYVIDMGYKQWDKINDKYYTSGNKSKHERERVLNNGPFLSLVEPSQRVLTCYCRPHTYLIDGYPFEGRRKAIPSTRIGTFGVMVIHDNNMMNKITGYVC